MKSISMTAAVLSAFAGSAAAHIHMTVDTSTGTAGDQISIAVGYYGSESAFSLDPSGRLLENGSIAEFHIHDVLHETGYEGWGGNNVITLTTDFYASTGRIDGGHFSYEIVGIDTVSGPDAIGAWGGEGHGHGLEISARSDGATRDDRSFHIGDPGNHPHGQFTAVSEFGVYDISLVAWDENGVYLDSDPVTFRVNVTPAPGTAALLGLGVFGVTRRRRG